MTIKNDILVVDDEIPSLQLMAGLLEKEGYRVRPAEDGQTALDSALAKPPAVILLDVRMPGMDGFELCRRLKQDKRTRHVPIIFISALQDTEARVRGFEAGGVDFISKPFQEKEILARVRTHLRLHQLQLQLEQLVEERTAELNASKDRLLEHVRAVEESEKHLSLIYESTADVLFYINVEPDDCFRFLSINPAFLGVTGLTRDRIVGKRIEDVIPETSIQLVLDNYKKAIKENRVVRWEETSVYPSGEKIGIVSVAPVLNEKGICTHLVGSVHDITKEKEAELNYRTVADFTYDWEYWVNMDGTLNYISPSCERISGYSGQDFNDNPSLLREIIIPQDHEVWDIHYHDSRQELKPREIQFRIQRRDGEIRWIEHFCQPVTDNQGLPHGFRASNRDITDRKQAEMELHGAFAEIKQLKSQLEAESAYLQEEIKSDHNFENIIGASDALGYVLYRVSEVAPTDAPVLVLGETGTGKELIARAIHHASSRGGHALVKINCANLPAALIESELFGHKKGAFTGADSRRIGRFQLADNGTLFLDEISEIPIDLQAKLLRVLQDNEFEPVGSSKTVKVDVRIIAASNRSLDNEVRAGRFRQDLLYRINVFPITAPPLRHRKEDIPLLVNWFVDKFNRKMGKRISSIPASLIKHLQSYDWPGNVRELENVIERAVITSKNSVLKLTEKLTTNSIKSSVKSNQTLAEVEKNHILKILEATGWKIEGANGAAKTLGLAPSTLRSRMKKLGIKRY